MTTVRANVLCWIFIAITVATAAILYPSLPEQIPTHWNIEGEVDDYTAKPWGVIILPLAAVFVFVIMKLIPVISPKGFRTDQFAGVLNIFMVVLVGFTSGVGLLVLLEASGRNVYINEMIFAGVGLLLIVIGNYLGKLRKNFFLGIRTPCWIFVLIGFFLFLQAFIRFSVQWVVGAIVVVALVPIIYSYVLYRKIEGFTDENTGDE
jgi:uncharacterized membrane protein